MNFDAPYPSRRMPLLARNVVATSQPLAAQAGLRMLLRGGTAIDAAIAAAATLTVVEPTSNGIGSDAFAIVWDGERLHGLNGSGRSPRALGPERFAGRDAIPLRGWDAVTVPGAVSSWVELWRRFGRLPFADLFEPAIGYARDGFPMSPLTARAWSGSAPFFADAPDWQRDFAPGGKTPRAGETWRFPDQARSLEAIAASEGEAFYRGGLADAIVAHARDQGALLDEADLAEHRSDWVGTVSTPWRGHELHEIPPNGQGIATLVALGLLRHVPGFDDLPVDAVAWLHLQVEATKLALADTYRWVADADHMRDVTVADLLDDGYLAERARLIDPPPDSDPGYGTPARGGTVYLTAADAEGRMVSFIQSNYHGFGSGVVVPGTGISLQNRGAGFVLEPGHPNAVAGGKRPFHTIIPAFLTEGGAPRCSFGLMGGPMQAQGHLQMVLRMVGHGQNPQAAADAPRWRVVAGRELAIESTFGPETLDGLRALGHQLTPSAPEASFGFGGAQLIWRAEDGYVAGTESRKDGQAVGY
ncbi:MAG: gamma-glutamyltransferase family protein [bacterium]|nr:gamma-glutamyltransferase family protein [bacterium]